jgi:hypothetical protein
MWTKLQYQRIQEQIWRRNTFPLTKTMIYPNLIRSFATPTTLDYPMIKNYHGTYLFPFYKPMYTNKSKQNKCITWTRYNNGSFLILWVMTSLFSTKYKEIIKYFRVWTLHNRITFKLKQLYWNFKVKIHMLLEWNNNFID